MRMEKSVLWTILIWKVQLLLLRLIIFALSRSSRAILTLLFKINGSGPHCNWSVSVSSQVIRSWRRVYHYSMALIRPLIALNMFSAQLQVYLVTLIFSALQALHVESKLASWDTFSFSWIWFDFTDFFRHRLGQQCFRPLRFEYSVC